MGPSLVAATAASTGAATTVEPIWFNMGSEKIATGKDGYTFELDVPPGLPLGSAFGDTGSGQKYLRIAPI